MMEFTFETLEEWPFGGTGTGDRRAPFKAAYPKTVDLLKDELERAHARNPAIQSGHYGADIRNDGLPRVNARVPRFSGVCLTFEMWTPTGGKDERGQPLGRYELHEFPCATFGHWEDNLRAIALTLKAIRETKKYGVGRVDREQHYAGFRHARVEARTGAGGALTREAAAAVLAACARGGWTQEGLLSASPEEVRECYLQAAANQHPDRGGSHESFVRVQEAHRVLAGASQAKGGAA